MSEELRACPFCGGKAVYIDDEGVELLVGETSPDVACYNTGCMPPTAYIPAASWNHRPIEDELRKRITELEKELANAEELLKYGWRGDCQHCKYIDTPHNQQPCKNCMYNRHYHNTIDNWQPQEEE